MKKIFNNIERRLLVTKPVVWVSSIYWILALSFLLIVIQVIIGMAAKFAADLTVFYTSSLVLLVGLLLLWISFQYRNYDKIFTIRQTFRIFLYNILSYIAIYISSLVLVVIMAIRFNAIITEEGFSRDLLSLRIANLQQSDIDFIVQNPQLFTSKGTNSGYDQSGSVNLKTEFDARNRLDENPFIKSNISYRYRILTALRKVSGFEYLDSVLNEMKATGISTEIDEDPVFYKYITSLSTGQLDSIRRHSNDVIKKYGIETTPAYDRGTEAGSKFVQLQSEITRIELNSDIPKAQPLVTTILLMALCSITFNFILTKNILCLFAPFVYLSLLALAAVLAVPLSRMLYFYNMDLSAATWGNFILFLFLLLVLRMRRRIQNKSVLFFIKQLQNLSALVFFVFLFIYSTDADLPAAVAMAGVIFSIAGFLTTHYFFIRKMHHTLIQEN